MKCWRCGGESIIKHVHSSRFVHLLCADSLCNAPIDLYNGLALADMEQAGYAEARDFAVQWRAALRAKTLPFPSLGASG